MRTLLKILIFLTFTVCKGQVHIDAVNRGDIQEIILNYKDNNVHRFKITQKSFFNNRRRKYVPKLYYTIDKDSILTHRYGKQKETSLFIIRDKDFIYVPKESEQKKQQTNYFDITYDSLNAKSTNTYIIKNEDTLLFGFTKIIYDSLNRQLEKIYWSNINNNHCHKWVYSYISDTTTTRYYKHDEKNWYIVSKETSYSIKSEQHTPSEILTLLKTISKLSSYKEDGKLQSSGNNVIIRTTSFDKNNLIQCIKTEENTSGFHDTTKLYVKRLDK